MPSRESQGFKKRGRGWAQQIPASVLGMQMALCHVGCDQGWPDADTQGVVSPLARCQQSLMPRCLQLFLVLSVPPPVPVPSLAALAGQ